MASAQTNRRGQGTWFLIWATLAACLCLWLMASPALGTRWIPVVLLVALLLAGVIFPPVWFSRDLTSITKRRAQARLAIDTFRALVHYERRVRRSAAFGNHGRIDEYGKSDDGGSIRQKQHEWYGSHSEFNWRNREQGELLGFDSADEFGNTWLESE